ncbi:MAG TPA: preprotein translocase subunit SecE [Candidatus Hydrogenedentes bacterium]|nr:preprotein translocase subunit SecE [Candidatus Hydrogenedentota bacterium]HQE83682.1 preprotein translocase subunit SecE [Candidatus Hydrogenedentota bacterium]HQM50857.1 preprotein translocase subunit SecE [Candidatus Hydrogenedentota bacterium]
MAKEAVAAAESTGFVARIREFFHEVKVEMRKVSWPAKDEVRSSTTVVLFMLGMMAFVIGIYDKVSELFVWLLLKLG